MNISCLQQKQASENRFFLLVLSLGSKKRKDEALDFEIFGGLEANIVDKCVTL